MEQGTLILRRNSAEPKIIFQPQRCKQRKADAEYIQNSNNNGTFQIRIVPFHIVLIWHCKSHPSSYSRGD